MSDLSGNKIVGFHTHILIYNYMTIKDYLKEHTIESSFTYSLVCKEMSVFILINIVVAHFICRSRMSVTTLSFLVTILCVATFAANNQRDVATAYQRAAVGNIFRTKTLNVNDNRRKRAVTPFNVFSIRAWKALLKTTQGSLTLKPIGKTYVKVGTMDDAVKDFLSFRPKGIHRTDDLGSLRGDIGNRVIQIEKYEDEPPLLTITDRSDVTQERSIYYFKNAKEAKSHFDAWKDYVGQL